MLVDCYKTARILSLDIVFGACVCALFVASYLSVSLSWPTLGCLAICIWLVYTLDHLLDASRVKHQAHSQRHRFHQKYFKYLSLAAILVAGLGLWLSRSLDEITFQMGLITIVLVLVYFWFLRLFSAKFTYHKELFAAFLYSIGVFLGPVSSYAEGAGGDLILLFIQFTLIAFTNLLVFSHFELDLDQKDDHLSLVRSIGKERNAWLVYALIALVAIISLLSIILLFHNTKLVYTELVLLGMLLTLGVIFWKANYFQERERYRALGDAIFFYPLMLLA